MGENKKTTQAQSVEEKRLIPDENMLTACIDAALRDVSSEKEAELREYLFEETYFVIGTGVSREVVERLVKRTIDIYETLKKEKEEKSLAAETSAPQEEGEIDTLPAQKTMQQDLSVESTEGFVDVAEDTKEETTSEETSDKRGPLDMLHAEKGRPSHTVAIDISDRSVEVLQLDTAGRVIAYNRVELEEGVVEDGEILMEEELVRVIKSLLSKTRPHVIDLKKEKPSVALSFPESKTFIRRMVFSEEIDKKDLEGKVAQEAKNIIPFESEDLLWDYRVLSKKAEKTEVLYVAVVSALVDVYERVLNKVGLSLELLDTELSSVGELLVSDEKGEVGIAVMDIGARTTNFGVFDQSGFLVFSAAVPYGGNIATEYIAEQKGVSVAEAEVLKREEGFGRSNAKNTVAPILEKHIEKYIREYKKAILYYENQTGEKIRKILLTGGMSLVPEIETYLSKQLQIPVERKNPLYYVKRPHYIDGAESVLYTNVIGLAVRSTKRFSKGINVLKRRKKAQTKTVSFLPEGMSGHTERMLVRKKFLWVLWGAGAILLLFDAVMVLRMFI